MYSSSLHTETQICQQKESLQIPKIIQKPYEERTIAQHAVVCELICENVVNFQVKYQVQTNTIYHKIETLLKSTKFVKMMTFYLELIQGQKWILSRDFDNQTILITGLNLAGDNYGQQRILILQKEKKMKIFLQSNKFALLLNPINFRTLQSLSLLSRKDLILNTDEYKRSDHKLSSNSQTTIQKQIVFLSKCAYFQSMLKKRHYWLLRNSSVHYFSHGQNVITQGQNFEVCYDHNTMGYSHGSNQRQQTEHNYVYLVREGEFVYRKHKKDQNKQIDIYQCGEGHIFGSYEIIQNISNGQRTNIPKKKNHQSQLSNYGDAKSERKRKFTVKCKSSVGIVYRFTQEVFVTKIKPNCEQIVMNYHKKLQKFLLDLDQKLQKGRGGTNKDFVSQTFSRSFSNFDQILLKKEDKNVQLLASLRSKGLQLQQNAKQNPTKCPQILLGNTMQMQNKLKTCSNSFNQTISSPLKMKKSTTMFEKTQSLSVLQQKKQVTATQERLKGKNDLTHSAKTSPNFNLRKNNKSLGSLNNNNDFNKTKGSLFNYRQNIIQSKQSSSELSSPQKQDKKYTKRKSLDANLRPIGKQVELDYKEIEHLLDKKQKFSKVKEIMGLGNKRSRGQVLFGLFKSTWEVQKAKKMRKNRNVIV